MEQALPEVYVARHGEAAGPSPPVPPRDCRAAYLLGADNSIGPLLSRLRGAQQPVVRLRHAFAAPRSRLLARL